MRDHFQLNQGFRQDVNLLLSPETDYLRKKLEDHRVFLIVLNCSTAVFGCLMWFWDYFTDPVGAQNTVYLRLLHLALFLNAINAWTRASVRWFGATAFVNALLVVGLFVLILTRLQDGFMVGVGGFMYFMLMPIGQLQGLSFRRLVGIAFCAAALPHLMALGGFAPGFPHVKYALLIWPAFGVIVISLMAFEFNYARRYHAERALAFDAQHDAMTGIWNRRFFMPMALQEVLSGRRHRSPPTLLMLDIDHFKRINDTHGHPTGDAVICKLATVCMSIAARANDVVARLGGEEFAVLLPDTSLADAALLAEKIRAAVESVNMVSLAGVEFQFTVSIGVAKATHEDASEANVVARADAALYQAKNSGRNWVATAG